MNVPGRSDLSEGEAREPPAARGETSVSRRAEAVQRESTLLTVRELATLFVLVVCTMWPVTVVVPVLEELIADRFGVGDFMVSTFMALNMLGALIAAPLFGWLSDRYGWTKRILVIACLADAALWWAMSWVPNFAVLSVLRLCEGVSHIAALSMLLTIVSRSSGQSGKTPRMALMGGGITLGVAMGAPLGGQLARWGATAPLQAGAVVMVASAVVAMLRVSPNRSAPDAGALPRWPSLYAPPALRMPYLFGFVDRLTVGFFVIGFPTLAARHLEFAPWVRGMLIGAFMLPFAALSYPAGRLADRYGKWRFVLGGSLLYGFSYAAIPWLGFEALCVNMVVCGVLSAVMFGPNLMLVLSESRAERRSSAVAGFNTAGSLGFLIGPLLAGAMLEVLGGTLGACRSVFAAGAATEIACVLVAYSWLRRWRQGSPTGSLDDRNTHDQDSGI